MVGEHEQLDLFIGSNSSYEKYKRDNKIHEDESDNKSIKKKPSEKVESTVTVLSKNTLKEISDDMMAILKRTRCLHDYKDVYMQSSLDFYDEFYNDTEMSDELKAARQIRRVYKDYSDYLTAIDVRNNYIDSIIEKHGGEDEFQRKLSIGLIDDWIPILPILSKRCEDYDLYLSGMLPVETEPIPKEVVENVMAELQENITDDYVEESFGVETSIGVIRAYNDYVDSAYNKWNVSRNGSSVISDLNELNALFKSWYKPDGGDTHNHEIFKNAPENIKKRFFDYCSFDEPGLLTKVKNGEDIDDDLPDQNEMVRDEKTGRSMTRHELEQRETIRLLAENGWSETRLLNYSNIGSKLEQMTRKKRASKKRNKRASTSGFIDDDFFMNSPLSGIDSTYADNEYMSNAFMELMRGDSNL